MRGSGCTLKMAHHSLLSLVHGTGRNFLASTLEASELNRPSSHVGCGIFAGDRTANSAVSASSSSVCTCPRHLSREWNLLRAVALRT